MTLPAVLTPLRHGPFARYIGGESVSMIGTWMQTFAQAWLLTTLTPSAIALGAVNAALTVPMVLLTLVGGTFADRYDKRVILLVALVIQLLNAVVVGWLVQSGQIAIWHIFVSAMLLGITLAFENPAVSAFVPELVPREQMGNAIAIDRSIFHATRSIGPALAGLVTSRFGLATAYYVNAASYLALIAAVLTIPARKLGTAAEEAERGGSFREGWQWVRSDGPTLEMVLLLTAMTMFVSPFLMVALPIYIRQVLGGSEESLGWLMGLAGLGSFVGSLVLLVAPRGRRTLLLKCALGAIIVALSGLALAQIFAHAGCAIVLLTLGAASSFGLANIVIQERAPAPVRGRVSAVASLAFFGVLPFSGLLITAAIDWVGMRTTLGAACAGFAVAATALLAGRKHLSPPAETKPTEGSSPGQPAQCPKRIDV